MLENLTDEKFPKNSVPQKYTVLMQCSVRYQFCL